MLSGLVPNRPRPKVNVMRYSLAPRPQKPTVRVLMLKTTKGAPDSITTVEYEAGKEYDIPEDLAGCFFSTHSADPAEAHQQPEYSAIFDTAESAVEPATETRTRPRRRPPPSKS